MKNFVAVVISCFLLCGLGLAAEKKPQDRAKLEEMTRLQVFLDNANFGPGKIDGRGGEFTSKALALYRKSQEGAEAPAPKAGKEKKEKEGANLDVSGLDLQSVGEPFIQYTVTKEDVESVGDAPKDPKALSKLKYVPYRSVLEAVAEKFHAGMDFLKEINPGADLEKLKEGDAVTVPNVKPFELAAVKQIKPGEAFQQQPPIAEQPASPSTKTEEPGKADEKESDAGSGDIKLPEGLTIYIDTKDKMLQVRDKERILAAFPVTPGSDDIPTPIGEWKVKGVARMPDFRYDKKMLKEGERGKEAHLVPPGPNNLVGVVWIALNKKGIGIHGTDNPETIGRAASHGCIRLANWDAAKLARMVKGGVPVKIE